jgi:hypothetical protein
MKRQDKLPALSIPAVLVLAAAYTAPAADFPGFDFAEMPVSAVQGPVKARVDDKAPASDPAETRDVLGDAFIFQNTLRIYLSRPATVTVYNARGQLLHHIESSSPLEVLPLSSVNTGFLYLTIRAGQLELTKKLVYSGK